MRVLVVEDEPKMAEMIRRVLAAEDHAVEVAPDGASGLASVASAVYDIVILDRMLPDTDGLEVVRTMRTNGDATPVLMLTALAAVEHRVGGLDAGADDYLAKPFAFDELLARIRAIGRRSTLPLEHHLAAGDLVLDEQRHVVRRGDDAVELTAREFAFLGYLMRHAGQVVTRRQILDAVWGAEPEGYSNVVDLYVHYLRRKLRSLGRAGILRTVRGVGYSLRPD